MSVWAKLPEVKIPKKRGRKPKGGKIINNIDHKIENKIVKTNIILHLKCSLKDITDDSIYDPSIHNIETLSDTSLALIYSGSWLVSFSSREFVIFQNSTYFVPETLSCINRYTRIQPINTQIRGYLHRPIRLLSANY